MRTRKLSMLTGLMFAVLTAVALVALSSSATARPRPRPRVHPRKRPVKPARRRVLPPRRRPLVVRRRGPGPVVIRRGPVVVRKMPPPVVVTSVESLKQIPTPNLKETTAYKVVRVDADCTVVLKMGDRETPVRLIGVDAALPENADQNDSTQAKQFFANLLAGEFVYVKYDPSLAEKDENGQIAAYLYRAPDGLFVNLELVRQGYAVAATGYPHEHQKTFSFYESKACADAKGVWKSAVSAGGKTPKQEDSVKDIDEQETASGTGA